jgi:hypothetical protein
MPTWTPPNLALWAQRLLTTSTDAQPLPSGARRTNGEMLMVTLLFALLALHGSLHVLGFLKSWRLAELPQMRTETLFALPRSLEKLVGAAWLIPCALFLASAVALTLHVETWWAWGLSGALCSQLLIIYAWPVAKTGTLINLLMLGPLLAAAGQSRFTRETERTVRALWSNVPSGEPSLVSAAELAPLPTPVRRWLVSAGVVGRARVRTLRLKQTGWMRTSPEGRWMPTQAVQYFNAAQPGFVWRAEVRMPVLSFAGRDTYLNGRGRMLIALSSLVPVVDASDAKTQQGTLLRFLGETVWFPSAALSPYLHWEAIDEQNAQVSMRYRGVHGSARFSFGANGQVTRVSAERYMGSGPNAKLEHWSIPMREWRSFAGYTIPVAGDVIWQLAGGDFNYFRWHIDDVEYDPGAID